MLRRPNSPVTLPVVAKNLVYNPIQSADARWERFEQLHDVTPVRAALFRWPAIPILCIRF